MAQNMRVYYPVHAIGFAPNGTTGASGYRAAKGVQTVGSTTSFNLEQVYELGQLSIYENIENIPNVEMTLDKVIDGYPLLQHLATPLATSPTLAGRYQANQCMVVLQTYNYLLENATGIPLSTAVHSGMYVSQIGFTIPVEGNATESISLVGNDKVWNQSPAFTYFTAGTQFTGNESPVLASGGVVRRENVNMSLSRWPTELPGLSATTGINVFVSGSHITHIQNVNVSVNLGRVELFELGKRAPYFRYATFPTEVTCSIDVTADERGDAINAYSEATNLSDQLIRIVLDHNITIDLGTKNKLQSVTRAGGDAGQDSNVTTTYNYSNFNDFKVTQPNVDPAGLNP